MKLKKKHSYTLKNLSVEQVGDLINGLDQLAYTHRERLKDPGLDSNEQTFHSKRAVEINQMRLDLLTSL